MKTDLVRETAQAAQAYLKAGHVEALPYEGYEAYLQQGNRIDFENHYFARRRQLAVLGLAMITDPKPELLKLLEQVIWEVCNEYTWALPAHLPLIEGRFAPESRTCLDLFAAETGATLAELFERLEDQFSPFLKERMLQELETRILTSYESRPWAWEQKENNWSSVIGGAVGLTVLSVVPKGSPRQLQLVKRLDTAMQSYLRGFGEDGACEEGVAYWSYGFGYFVYYADKLAKTLGDSRYIQLAKVKKIAAFPYYAMINEEEYVPFSDYSQSELPSCLVSWCHEVMEVPIPTLKGISSLDFDHCYRFAHLLRNLEWTTAAVKKAHEEKAVHYFDHAQWLTLRDPQQNFYFAAKGGTNVESHNHLDVGHFVVGTTAELFLTDLGAGEYTRDYFNERLRYDFFVNGSAGHGLPTINGTSQQPGPAGAKVVAFVSEDEQLRFALDLTATYGKTPYLTEFQRTWQVSAAEKTVLLTDDFTFSATGNQVEERFITRIRPQIKGTEVLLTQKSGATCRLALATEEIITEEIVYSDHEGRPATAYVIKASYHLAMKAALVVKITID